jgi:ABC-type multidrug transport system fused ATPase/permease subunit
VNPALRSSPYQGLVPYTEEDYAYFYGRRQEIVTISANLEVARLTLFYGPSGVGKTSVLRAGVIHHLHRQAQRNGASRGPRLLIPVYFNRWHQTPLSGLTQTIGEAVARYRPPGEVAQDAGQPFVQQVEQWTGQTNSHLLVVLDQFEEYFLYSTQAGSDEFARALVQAVNSPDLRINFLLSLREDTLARLDHFRGRIPFLLDNRLTIMRLTPTSAREAIEKPLEQYSAESGRAYVIEPALTTAILNELVTSGAGLTRQGQGLTGRDGETIETPYLQLVLSRLWAEEAAHGSTTLRYATLTRLAGATAIVSKYLDETMAALSEQERAMAAGFFDRLVTPSGSKIALAQQDLMRFAGQDEAAVNQLLQTLLRQRILQDVSSPQGAARYEITHDILGQAILAWLERHQASQAESKRLAEEQAARLAAEAQAAAAEERARLQEEARREAQARAEAEAERAEAETRRVRQARWALAVVSLLLLVAAGLLVWAFGERAAANAARAQADANAATAQAAEATAQAESTRAIAGEQTAEANRVAAETQAELARLAQATAVANERMAAEQKVIADERAQEAALQAQIAGSRQLAAQSASALAASNMELALLLAIEAGRVSDTLEAFSAIRTALAQTGRTRRVFYGHTASVLQATWSADESKILTRSDDQTARIWDAASGEELVRLSGHTDWVLQATWSVDESKILTSSADQTARIWDAASGEELVRLSGHTASVWQATWSADESKILTSSADQTARIWYSRMEDLLTAACGQASRNLTLDEWNRFGKLAYRPTCPDAPLPPDAIEAIRAQATALVAAGEIVTATARLDELNRWLQENGQFKTYGRESHSFVASLLVEQGRTLAQAGELDQALTKFEQAAGLDETLDPNGLAAEAKALAVSLLLEQGRTLAQAGKLAEALAKFEQAAGLDQTLDLAALAAEATQIAASAQRMQAFEQARNLAAQGEFDRAGERLAALATETPALALGVPVTATTALTPLWHFSGSAGQVVTIVMVDTEDGPFDPYLTLVKPNGEVLAENDDSGAGSDGYDARIAEVTLPEDGLYFILAGRAGSSVVYELTLSGE